MERWTLLEENCDGLACDTSLEIIEDIHKEHEEAQRSLTSSVSLRVTSWMSLEEKLQSELHLPHRRDDAGDRTRPGARSELRREGSAGRGRQSSGVKRGVRHAELRRVEEVENLGSELQPQFLADRNVFDQREIHVLEPRTFQNRLSGAAVVTELSQIFVARAARRVVIVARLTAGHDAERVRIEPFIDRRIIQFSRTQTIGADGRVARVDRIVLRNSERQP